VKRRTARKNPGYRIITLEDPSSYSAEAYRRLKVRLDYLSCDKKIQVIQICSATPGDGKTTTFLNLAVAYAESGIRVLLIDMDLRKPKIHRAFRAENTVGLSEYLSGDMRDISEIVKHSEYKNIDFITSGLTPVRPTAFFSREKLREGIEALRGMYDIILIDEPPILAASDCCIIAKYCDGALFQISQRNTEKQSTKDAVKMLRQNGVNILGCVFTEVKKSSIPYSYKY